MPSCNCHKNILTIIYLLILGFMFSISTIPVFAQDSGLDITISPPLKVVDITGTGPIPLSYTIVNNSSVDLVATPVVKRFHSDNISGIPIIEDTDLKNAVIETPGYALDKPFSLPSQQPISFVLTITPTNVNSDILGTLLIKAHPASSQAVGTSTSFTIVIGSNIILKSALHNPSPISITQINMPKIFDVFSPITVQALAINSDSSSTQIHGTVELKETHELIALFPDLIIGNSTRELRGIQNYGNNQSIPKNIQFSGFHFPGIYHLHFTITVSDGKPREITQEILVLPISLSIVFFSGIVLLCLYYFFFSNRKLKS